jgi:hypothetical protein
LNPPQAVSVLSLVSEGRFVLLGFNTNGTAKPPQRSDRTGGEAIGYNVQRPKKVQHKKQKTQE